jgi:hypothetical protein
MDNPSPLLLTTKSLKLICPDCREVSRKEEQPSTPFEMFVNGEFIENIVHSYLGSLEVIILIITNDDLFVNNNQGCDLAKW